MGPWVCSGTGVGRLSAGRQWKIMGGGMRIGIARPGGSPRLLLRGEKAGMMVGGRGLDGMRI